jgi:hypothetical protein
MLAGHGDGAKTSGAAFALDAPLNASDGALDGAAAAAVDSALAASLVEAEGLPRVHPVRASRISGGPIALGRPTIPTPQGSPNRTPTATAVVRMPMAVMRKLGLAVVLVLVTGCSKESMLRSALEDPAERRETMELTLKIFDEHPEYVDDLFVLARGHDPTFERLVQQAAIALEDPAFAASVANKLARHPVSVQLITRAMLVEARSNPELRRAMATAILSEGDVMQQIAAENPELVQQVLVRIISGAR